MGSVQPTLLESSRVVKIPRAGGTFGGRRINAPFAQAATAAIERLALYLYRWLSPKTGQLLEVALYAIRDELGLGAPRHPLMSWRDWLEDDEAGDALGALLARLDTLEYEERPAPTFERNSGGTYASRRQRTRPAA